MIRVAAAENCSGCRLCALACSFHTSPQQEFSLAASAIRIDRIGGENTFQPQVLDTCTGCARCVPYCEYGVLAVEKGGQA